MTGKSTVDSLLQWPGELLDRIVALLGKVGIDLAPLWLQAFLFVIVVALLIPVMRRVRARRKADRLPAIAAVVLALALLGIVIGIVENASTPRRVAGSVGFDRLQDVRVTLLDFRDLTVSTGSGQVDSSTGQFALHYSPLMNGRARKLRISAPGCKPIDMPLARSQLRAASEVKWTYSCVPG